MEHIKRFFRKVKDEVVQDCPPELYACEVCGKLECANEEWLNCEKRLQTAEAIRELEGELPTCPHESG